MSESAKFPKLISVVAVSQDGGIGYQSDLLFRFKEDLQHFRALTRGHTVICGRKTFESIPKPLPEREFLVLSHSMSGEEVTQKKREWGSDIQVFKTSADLDEYLMKSAKGPVFVIGGQAIYEIFFDRVSEIHLTWIDEQKPADAFFPRFAELCPADTPPAEWGKQLGFEVVSQRKSQERNDAVFLVFRRRE